MKTLTSTLIGLMAVGTLAVPVKALTEEEVAIGLQLVSCLSQNGCYYRNNSYYSPHNSPYYPYKNSPNLRYSNPQIIIVPAQPHYRYTPPYSGYYFERHRQKFRQEPPYFNHRYNHGFNSGYREDVRGQINHIYRNILGRDADVDGLNTYQDRYNNGWSLGDIQRDIANSYEARSLRRY